MPEKNRNAIALLTDFGLQDPFVGVMKGVILSINPGVRLIDLTHGIRPQDVSQAGYVLAASYRYFPPGTIFVAVVDPGVGGGRRIIAVQLDEQIFIAPDNGLLTLLLQDHPMTRAVCVSRSELFRQPVSATFHGRDIMAPVAAHLALGRELADVGDPVEQIERLDISPRARTVKDGLEGTVICVDRFGNLITNIRADDLDACFGSDRSVCQIIAGERVINGIHRTYSDVAPGKTLALIGSIGRLEIAAHMGSAADVTGCESGSRIHVRKLEE